MPYINDIKLACATCIKGHRSSSCHHSDRPLFEVKKKGRPPTQCAKCRELRKLKKVHTKCMCPERSEEVKAKEERKRLEKEERLRQGLVEPPPKKKKTGTRAPLPPVPTHPNGLKDAILVHVPQADAASGSQRPEEMRVDALLNPCRCKVGGKCHCAAKRKAKAAAGLPVGKDCCGGRSGGGGRGGGCCSGPPQASTSAAGASMGGCCGSSNPSAPAANYLLDQISQHFWQGPGPQSTSAPAPSSSSSLLPALSALPHPPTAHHLPPASLLLSTCRCGPSCACPGCLVHNVPTLPPNHPSLSTAPDCGCSDLNAFLAHASALLPYPPAGRPASLADMAAGAPAGWAQANLYDPRNGGIVELPRMAAEEDGACECGDGAGGGCPCEEPGTAPVPAEQPRPAAGSCCGGGRETNDLGDAGEEIVRPMSPSTLTKAMAKPLFGLPPGRKHWFPRFTASSASSSAFPSAPHHPNPHNPHPHPHPHDHPAPPAPAPQRSMTPPGVWLTPAPAHAPAPARASCCSGGGS